MILIDTNVLSETIRPSPNPQAIAWLALHESECLLPAHLVAELRYGVEKLPDSRRRTLLEEWLEKVLTKFEDRVLPFDRDVAETHGRLRARMQQQGTSLAEPDGYIAATAIFHELPLATRNGKDFAHTGVRLINPWEV